MSGGVKRQMEKIDDKINPKIIKMSGGVKRQMEKIDDEINPKIINLEEPSISEEEVNKEVGEKEEANLHAQLNDGETLQRAEEVFNGKGVDMEEVETSQDSQLF